MEPRSDDRGERVLFAHLVEPRVASMEPRSDDRGEAVAVPFHLLGNKLQWSRGRMTAESRSTSTGTARAIARFNGAAVG